MKGCRPLKAFEVRQCVKTFQGRYKDRNAALFVLGICSGFRISELLSIRVRDIIQYGKVIGRLRVQRGNMKGKKSSRDVELTKPAEKALLRWIKEGLWGQGHIDPDTFVFRSQVGRNKPISRRQAARILETNFKHNQMTGPLATHSMRKTFANEMHDGFLERAKTEKIDPYFLLANAMGHENPANTKRYLSFKDADIVTTMNDFQSEMFGEEDA